jgi:oxygen-dependent protoporphyrinogen oxidase
VVRASLGRHGDDRSLEFSDDQLIASVRSEIADLVGITAAPLETTIARWPDSFPQYLRGHQARVNAIRRSLDGTGLFLAGAAYDGIGIPACVESGTSAAAAAAAS